MDNILYCVPGSFSRPCTLDLALTNNATSLNEIGQWVINMEKARAHHRFRHASAVRMATDFELTLDCGIQSQTARIREVHAEFSHTKAPYLVFSLAGGICATISVQATSDRLAEWVKATSPVCEWCGASDESYCAACAPSLSQAQQSATSHS